MLGFIIGLGGILAIWVLSSALQGEKEIIRPDNTVSYRKELPEGATYSQLRSDGIDTLGYLAYVLDHQLFYHSQSSTQSTANIFPVPQYTDSYKDYKDGIMLSSDFTYGIISEGTQSCFVPDGNKDGKGAGVYMRTAAGGVNESTTGTTADWNDDVTYYDREHYLYTYGEYSTEMTVYILNQETVLSWDKVRDNGDGTYSQKFYLDAEKAAYYYQYAMKTRGGLDRLPEFESITLDFTFDDNYRVLSIQAEENSRIMRYSMSMSSVSETTTTYAYTEESFDQPHRDLYENYYEQFVGELDSVGGGEEELDPLTLLMNAFAGVLSEDGQQFEATLTTGGKTYYGRIFLSVDMAGISSDILGSIEARIAISADETLDAQDLYIQLKDGVVEGYYSTDFALSADIGSFGGIIEKFQTWADSLSNRENENNAGAEDVAAAAEGGEEGGSLDDILNQLMNGMTTEETEGGLKMVLSLDDLMGIGLSAEFNFTKSSASEGTEYTFVNAVIGNISYSGEQIALSLGLEPSSAEIISHEKSEAPFNVAEAAENIYQLLDSESIKLELSLQGDKLADLLSSLTDVELGTSIDELRLEVAGGVDISGLTVVAGIKLTNYVSGAELLCADAYYEYNSDSGEYGTAYLNITNILGAQTDVKVYSDISELYATVTKVVEQVQGMTAVSAETNEKASENADADVAEEGGLDVAEIINTVLGLDFGSVIKEVTANSTVIGATVNADDVLSVFGINLSLGDITLKYSLGDFEREDYNAEGGWLYGSVPSLGAEAYIYGSTAALTQTEKEEYLDLNSFLNAALNILSGEEVGIDITLRGEALADILANVNVADLGTTIDDLTLTINGDVNVKTLEASVSVNVSKSDETSILTASVYYAYNKETNGTAYIKISNVLGLGCEVKVA